MADKRETQTDWNQSWVKVRFKMKYNAAPVRASVKAKAEQVASDFLDEVVKNAKANVAPGAGPGPHPHRTDHGWEWIDTGNLQDDIGIITPLHWQGTRLYGAAGCTTQAYYGFMLEAGWTSYAGNFYRYPWLYPAYVQAQATLSKWYKTGRPLVPTMIGRPGTKIGPRGYEFGP